MKKCYSILLLLFCSFFTITNVDAQGWQWERHIVNTPFVVGSYAEGLATDTAGNVFAATILSPNSTLLGGVTSTFGTTSIVDSYDVYQAIITKTDASGNVLWTTGSQHTNTGITNITTDKAGNAYILGVYDSANCTFGNYPLAQAPISSLSNAMYFMVKIDPMGMIVWAKNIVPTLSGRVGKYMPYGGIKADDSGHLYLSGTFREPTVTIGATTLTRAGTGSIFIAKYDTAGNPLWAKSYGNTGAATRGMGLTPGGELYMACNYFSSSISFGPDTLSNGSGMGAFLVKFDNSGNVLWARTADTTAYMWDLAVDSMANVYVCGYFSTDSVGFNSNKIANTSAGHSDGFIVKYSGDGTVLWAKNMGGDSSDRAEKIAVDKCGNVFITGSMSHMNPTPGGYNLHFDDYTQHLDIDPYSYPLFIARYSEAGEFLNCFTRHGSGANQPPIATDNKGSFYINTQYTNSTDTYGANVLVRDSGELYQFIAKYDYDSVGCVPYAFLAVQNITAVQVPNIFLFPNPARMEFSLHSDIALEAGSTLALLDVAGRLIFVTPVNGNTTTIPINKLAPGLYNCVINMQSGGVVFKKLVIVR